MVEILSPKISYRDREIKRKLYGKYGVKEYWIVDPIKQAIEVLSSDVAGYKKNRHVRCQYPIILAPPSRPVDRFEVRVL